jgi:hypothetical protein
MENKRELAQGDILGYDDRAETDEKINVRKGA